MKKLVVLSGSGISAESGISTFRGGGGMWNNYRVEDVASIDGWHRNPTVMLDFYNQMRKDLKGVEPNEAHRLLAELEKKFDVTVITQNVDNLHERAGSSLGDKGGPHNTQLRPHIVWFGEAVPNITAAAAIENADRRVSSSDRQYERTFTIIITCKDKEFCLFLYSYCA